MALYAAYIVGRAITNPTLIGVVPRTVAVNFFQRRRNFALGLQAMQRPVAGAVNIQVISLIAQRYSWRAAYRALGVFALLLVVPFLLLMRRRPEDIGLRPDGDSAPVSRRAAGSGALGEVSWSAREALVTPAFRLILAARGAHHTQRGCDRLPDRALSEGRRAAVGLRGSGVEPDLSARSGGQPGVGLPGRPAVAAGRWR